MQVTSVRNNNAGYKTNAYPNVVQWSPEMRDFHQTLQQFTFGKTYNDLKQDPQYGTMWAVFEQLLTRVTPSALQLKQDKTWTEEKHAEKCRRLEEILDYQAQLLRGWAKNPDDIHILRGPADDLPERFMIATIPSSPGMEKHQSISILVHNDIVAADLNDPFRPIVPTVIEDKGKFWVTSSNNTTLGADNKSGVVAGLMAAHHFLTNPELPHSKIKLELIR